MSKVWFITGAGSGIGAGIAKAALNTGGRAVASARNLEKLRNSLRDLAGENLVCVSLDVTHESEAKVAAELAINRFGRINVAVKEK
jgi:NAD(P)-dependent dehydrogenase (short-subunit alcohol dehydrogenase family)